jgi:late competence protein required for DNA uptake (superfamily II DNA/RNA helicase)
MNIQKRKHIEEMADNVALKPSGWSDWAKYVLISIEDIIKSHKQLEGKVEENKLEYINAINELRVEIVKQFGEYKRDIGVIQTKIERKSVAIGALAGFIPALITALFFLLK